MIVENTKGEKSVLLRGEDGNYHSLDYVSKTTLEQNKGKEDR